MTGGGGIGGLVEGGQGREQFRVGESRVVGPVQDATGSKPEDRRQFRIGLLAGQLPIGQSLAAVLVERREVREVMEWLEGAE